MRLGIYGGTFDPVHLGHLILAETVRESISLDQIWFVPAYTNPHKLDQKNASPKARLDMLEFALAGNPAFYLNNVEIKRRGPSFTVETLQSFQQQHPQDELFLLMGADSLADFPNWREPERILQLAKIVAVNRGQEPVEIPDGIAADKVILCEMPAIEISASEIRERCERGGSIRYLTPRSVELYIQANSLYANPDVEESNSKKS